MGINFLDDQTDDAARQPTPISFADGFESGDATSWTDQVP